MSGKLLCPWGRGHLPPTPITKCHSYPTSLTSHFDGHGLLGADQIDDFLMGTRRDGIAIDPDDLIPYLGTERCDIERWGKSAKQGSRPTPRCSQPQKGLSPSKSFNLYSSAIAKLPPPPPARRQRHGRQHFAVPGWRKQDLGWGEACSWWVIEQRW